MRKIDGNGRSIRELLGGAKFNIDYYQREYRWKTKQITELINDLTEKFLDSYVPGHERSAIENYGHYFLGSIIISEKDGKKFIIDGQQRLTSLTLLLIYIHRQLTDEQEKGQLTGLVFSRKYGRRSFNLDIPERTACMEALFRREDFDENGQTESVVNILERFQDIVDSFPEDLAENALPYFADWLIDNVHLVEITAFSDADAYAIFETMNDRGLSLTPTDMLKGYLLANIADTKHRNKASSVWSERIATLRKLGKEEDSDAIKAWLRGQHAESIRERKREAQPGDFDLIGTEFHRWVRDHEGRLGLNGLTVSGKSASFARFIQEDFSFYSFWYKQIRKAAQTLTEGLEMIHFNAQNNFTLQYPVLLASLVRDDSEELILHKLRIVAAYLDILIARRIWNWKVTSYSTMQYNMFQLVILKIRGKSVEELAAVLSESLNAQEEAFATNDRFSLHGRNRYQIHCMLARITDYLETQSGQASRYAEYMQRRGKNGYEVEHIWADRPERHVDEFDHPNDFGEYRNRIGGLLLLPKSFNASYNDLPYSEKRGYYFGQNLLAQSLHEDAYNRNPGFLKFRDDTGLPFQPHEKFRKADLDARQGLYLQIVEQIWDPKKLLQVAER